MSGDGNTPLDEDEADGLIPGHIATRAELNAWEALNIKSAYEWITAHRELDMLDVSSLRELHRHMFGETWSWAGNFRLSDKNISPHHWAEVPSLIADLVSNTRAQYDASNKTPAELDEIAMRFHYNLVRIHPWPNGNGRHARFATDLLLEQWKQPLFSWGGSDLPAIGGSRAAYVRALQAADRGEFDLLRRFVRS